MRMFGKGGGYMGRCPFWSTSKEKFQCYEECPMIMGETIQAQEGEVCIFKECSLSSRINLKDIVKDDYNFLNISIYDDEKNSNANY